MTCYNWEDLSKPLALISASYVGRVEIWLTIFSYIVRLIWDCSIGYSHKLGWSGFNQVVFAIWWWFLSSALGTPLKARPSGGSHVSLCCRLYGGEGTLKILGHLEDVGDDMGFASFLCFFLGLLYKLFKTLFFECNSTQLAFDMYTLGFNLQG